MVAAKERGAALIVALVTLVVVTMAVLLAAQFVQQRIDALKIEERQVRTGVLADASMAETLARLHQDQYFRGLQSRTLGKGLIESTVAIAQPGFRRVAAQGRVMGWQTTITAEVDLRFNRPRVVTWTYRQGPEL